MYYIRKINRKNINNIGNIFFIDIVGSYHVRYLKVRNNICNIYQYLNPWFGHSSSSFVPCPSVAIPRTYDGGCLLWAFPFHLS